MKILQKRLKTKFIIGLVISCLYLIIVLTSCGKNNDIIGTWQASISVIGLDENPPPAEESDNSVSMIFREDQTGAQILIAAGVSHMKDFTYTVSEGTLHIEYDDGETNDFSYNIEDNSLTLSQGNRSAVFTRTNNEEI